MSDFVHLHVHTEFSLLDGFSPIERLVQHASKQGMKALAITDHGCMFGVVQFYKTCLKYGIKPILGSEVYIAEGDYREKNALEKEQYHLILLAKDQEGYKNLMKIVSEGYINGYYYKPRVDMSVLREHSKGLIATSACLSGEIQQLLLNGQTKEAKDLALEYRKVFGDGNFFLEVQDHGIPEQKTVNRQLLEMSRDTGIPLVATNDVHYVEKRDSVIHDVLLCIQTGKTLSDTNRMRFPSNEFYLKSEEEMTEALGFLPGAIENTSKIANMCDVKLGFGELHLPEFKSCSNKSNEDYLHELTMSGLRSRYGALNDEIIKRTETELKVILEMGYVDYFLIVWDFIRYAKQNGIAVGPGRGSAAGSIVSYALGITSIDPLKYDLLFERFLNPERVSMPDIDIDFCYERREEVIDYVVEKYGEDRVAQIVTFGTMAARGAIRDVGRVLDMPYGSVDRVAKMIPMQLGITIDKALEISDELKSTYDTDDDVKKLIDYANAVEGMPRHTSTHAAGVVIAREPVTEYVPLSKNQDIITTQFNMIELEELGLLKMDFLGLRTLTVIDHAVKMIKAVKGIDIDIDSIDLNDKKVLKLFENAETLGIFQFESPGMRAFLKELKPTEFEDLVAANSLFRPGPMNEIPTYIYNKHNSDSIQYTHSSLESILNVTYGTIVYQEQVMQIVQKLAGYTLGGADLLRRAMGKKKMDVMEEERARFIHGEVDSEGNILVRGCVRNGIDETSANKIYDLMIDFAKYAFNKSHSVAYAYVAMQTAWLKTYYPVEFMASLMTSVMGQTSQVSQYMQECKRLGIKVLPPDINHSYSGFSADGDAIRFGLTAVKNVGVGLVNNIIKSRKEDGVFSSFYEFVERLDKIDGGIFSKKAIECLIKVGSFDSTGVNRASLIGVFEKLIDGVHGNSRRNLKGQISLLDIAGEEHSVVTIPSLKEFEPQVLLNMEKELTGLYISDHPLSGYSECIRNFSTFNTAELTQYDDFQRLQDEYDDKTVSMVGLVVSKKDKLTRNNKLMSFIELEDENGTIEVVVFPRIYQQNSSTLEEDSVILVTGRLSISDSEEPKFILERVKELKPDSKKLYVRLESLEDRGSTKSLKDTLNRYKGSTPVVVYYNLQKRAMHAPKNMSVDIDDNRLIAELKYLYGNDNVKIQ